MMDKYYGGEELIEKYSKIGTVEVNNTAGVARIIPYIEQRLEVLVDGSVPDDVPLEDIPPHLKQSIDLYFVNSEAIHPTKHSIRCNSPNQLQTFNGKAWVDIPYREEWANWEEDIKEMDNIDYPFVVVPNSNIKPRTFRLMEKGKMELFKTLLSGNNRQVTINDFEKMWKPLFDPVNAGNPEFPLSAWLHVSQSPNAYVDVVEPQSDRTVVILFTIPPLMTLNQGQSSVLDETAAINMSALISRCRSESNVIPRSGDERFIKTISEHSAKPTELNKHLEMWKKIYERYNWKFITDDTNTVNDKPVKEHAHDPDDDQMDEYVFGLD